MDVAGIITALVGLVGLIAGFIVSRRGQRDTETQQDLANSVNRDRNHLAETQQALDVYNVLVKTLTDEAKRATDGAEEMRRTLGLEREGRATDSLEYGLIEARCRRQSSTVAAALSILATMPVGDSAQAVIAKARNGMTIHPHDTASIT